MTNHTIREHAWRAEGRFITWLPAPLKRAYLETSKFVATQLKLKNLRFPVSSPRFGTMLVNRVDSVNAFIYFFSIWEPHVTALLEKRLQPGDVFIDVGANIGYYSLCAARLVGRNGRVYALEASPSIYERLEEHIELNELRNVSAVHCAVWDSEGELDIFLGPTKNEGNTSLQPSPNRKRESTVRAAPLSALVDEGDIARVKVVKIDVEGAEGQVIRGIESCLDQMPNDVMFLVEITKALMTEQGGSVEAALAPFEARGFRYYVIPNQYGFRFYLEHSDADMVIREISYREVVGGPEPRFDLAITRDDLSKLSH